MPDIDVCWGRWKRGGGWRGEGKFVRGGGKEGGKGGVEGEGEEEGRGEGTYVNGSVLTVYPGEYLPSTAETAKMHFGKNEEHEQLCGELLTAMSL